MSPLRIALVGSGMMGSLHARVIAQHLSTELTFVVDTDATRGLATAETWGSKWVPDLDDFGAIDALVVATPSETHLEWALRSLDAGRPTLVEKPLSQDLDEARRLVEASEANGVPLVCGLLERFNPAVLKMHEIVENPVHVNVVRHSPHTPRITQGVAFDLAIHDVDLAIRLAGERPDRVQAQLSRCHPTSPPGSEDIAEIALSFPRGLVAGLSASRVSQRKLRTLQVAELERLIEVDLLRRDITVYHHVGADFLEGRQTGYRQQTVIDIPAILDAREPLVTQLEHFVALAAGAGDVDAERRSILPPHEVLDQIVGSARVAEATR
ncbi:Gfo/Idh/MocA family protein [Rhabdothermincola salaria]|uniref:Gfo/Idh/MocA family protein n=1 Tax=Rhabdothermincola salaria TaxID=2903142 RepID=UPI001E442328|nr:Gfo/Idh/MocA family oxidoreductase [Rhabdothermincola salaria]MCD9623370.1 Gfo/Idh/MocA family oxidoreductase [Rhabdothermincola salaria]